MLMSPHFMCAASAGGMSAATAALYAELQRKRAENSAIDVKLPDIPDFSDPGRAGRGKA